MSRRPANAGSARGLNARDLAVLELAAAHRLFRAAHVARLLAVSEATARQRLSALQAGGWLSGIRLYERRPRLYQITTAGLRAVGSPWQRPRLDIATVRHDLGVCWLWLAAREGALGTLRELWAERELRSRQMRGAEEGLAPAQRPAVRAGGIGPAGGERVHFPDLVAVTAGGRRVALELELSGKPARRLERILTAYAADRRYDAVLYLTDDRRLAERVRATARRLGCASLVRVAQLRFDEPRAWAPPAQAGRTVARTPCAAALGEQRL